MKMWAPRLRSEDTFKPTPQQLARAVKLRKMLAVVSTVTVTIVIPAVDAAAKVARAQALDLRCLSSDHSVYGW